ncbi:uncharacterized protein LOC144094982 [Amblyomma americanum]
MASEEAEPYAGCGRGASLRAVFRQQTRHPGTECTSPADDSGRSSGSSSSADDGTSARSPSLSPFSDSASSCSSPSVPTMRRGILLGQVTGEASSSPSQPGPSSRGIVTAHGCSIMRMPAEQCVLMEQRSTMQQPHVSGAIRATAHAEARAELPTAEMSKLSSRKFRGKAGKPVSVEVNYARLGTGQGMGAFGCHTDFVLVIDSKRTRCQLVSSDPVMELICAPVSLKVHSSTCPITCTTWRSAYRLCCLEMELP